MKTDKYWHQKRELLELNQEIDKACFLPMEKGYERYCLELPPGTECYHERVLEAMDLDTYWCPNCLTRLVPNKLKCYETITEHVFDPNATPPLRDTFVCPEVDCIFYHNGFWGFDGGYYRPTINTHFGPFYKGFDQHAIRDVHTRQVPIPKTVLLREDFCELYPKECSNKRKCREDLYEGRECPYYSDDVTENYMRQFHYLED